MNLWNNILKNSWQSIVSLNDFKLMVKRINILAQQIKELLKLKVCIYSGNAFKKTIPELNLKYFDYVKVGPYIEECGPLNNENTNQRLYKVKHIFGLNKLINITEKFWNEHKTTIT